MKPKPHVLNSVSSMFSLACKQLYHLMHPHRSKKNIKKNQNDKKQVNYNNEKTQ